MARYQEIHQIIRKRIFDGAYPLGSNLPSEAAFSREFNTSRFTVREALRRLQIDGMVERKQGAVQSCRVCAEYRIHTKL